MSIWILYILHSTETALLEITDIITKELDRGKLPIGIFLDLPKAFDTLDHNILFKKLKHYGIIETESKWFKCYLTNRTQYVSFDGIHSSMLPTKQQEFLRVLFLVPYCSPFI